MQRVLYSDVTVLDLVLVAVLVLVSVGAAKMLAIYLRRTLREKMSRGHLEILIKVIYYGIVAVAGMVALALLGVNLSGLMVAGGIAGIVIGFASQRIVGNLISGVFLMIERPIAIGDQVEIDGVVQAIEVLRINNDVYPDVAIGTKSSDFYTGDIFVLPAYGTLPSAGIKINLDSHGEVVTMDIADFNRDNKPDIVFGTRTSATEGSLVVYFGRE